MHLMLLGSLHTNDDEQNRHTEAAQVLAHTRNMHTRAHAACVMHTRRQPPPARTCPPACTRRGGRHDSNFKLSLSRPAGGCDWCGRFQGEGGGEKLRAGWHWLLAGSRT